MSDKKIKMTKEIKKQLAGLLPMMNDSVYEYTPEIFDEVIEDFRPVFSIKQLNNEQVIVIKQMIMDEARTSQQNRKPSTITADIKKKNKVYMEYTHSIMTGWESLYDLGTGKLIPYDGTFEQMMNIPESILNDIFGEAMRITGFLPHGLL